MPKLYLYIFEYEFLGQPREYNIYAYSKEHAMRNLRQWRKADHKTFKFLRREPW